MARFRREELALESVQSSDNTTYELNLPKNGLLSCLELKFAATNGATSNKASEIWRCITDISVVDGGRTLYFATGHEAMQATWFWLKKQPPMNSDETLSQVQFVWINIPFGRHVGDRKFGLDLSRMSNPKLKVRYNLATINAVGATGFVTGTTTISVISYRDPAGSPTSGQYLRMTRLDNFTSAASGTHRTEVTPKNDLIGIGVSCYEAAIADNTDITRIEVDVEKGESTPYEGEWDQIQEENTAMFGIDPSFRGRSFESDTDTIETWTGTCKTWQVFFEDDVDITNDTFNHINVDTVSGSTLTLNASTGDLTAGAEDLTANTTDDTVVWEAAGIGVGHFAFIPLDVSGDWSDPLRTRGLSSVDINLTQGGAGATVGVLLYELESN